MKGRINLLRAKNLPIALHTHLKQYRKYWSHGGNVFVTASVVEFDTFVCYVLIQPL